MKTISAKLILGLSVLLVLGGCVGGGDTPPIKDSPAVKGPGGVPLLSDEQMSKLSPEKQEEMKRSQQMMQQAAQSNLSRHQTGQMPNGG
jgi:hypothetical protein